MNAKERLVWMACNALVETGAQPTYQKVGDWLVTRGHPRGSNSDIGRYINSWKSQSVTSASAAPTVSVTANTPAPIESPLTFEPTTVIQPKRNASLPQASQAQVNALEARVNYLTGLINGERMRGIKEWIGMVDYYQSALANLRKENKQLKEKINQLKHQAQ